MHTLTYTLCRTEIDTFRLYTLRVCCVRIVGEFIHHFAVSVTPPSLNCIVIQLPKSSWMRVRVSMCACVGVCRIHMWMFIVTLFEWPNRDNGLCCNMNELRQQQTQQTITSNYIIFAQTKWKIHIHRHPNCHQYRTETCIDRYKECSVQLVRAQTRHEYRSHCGI